MRAAVIASGVLGIGTAVVFALAAVAASMFPDGGTVVSAWNGGKGNFGGPVPIAVPQPIIVGQGSGGVQVTLPDASPSN